MTSGKLQGVRVAILASDGFEEFELLDTRSSLDHAGAATFIVAARKDRIIGSREGRGRKSITVDIPLTSAKPEDFHALFLPGGKRNAESLATNDHVLGFVNAFMRAAKPVGAMAEGLRLLLQTGSLAGRTIASGSIPAEDLKNASVDALDQSVVCDGNLITARTIADVEAFNAEFTRMLADIREHSSEIRRTA